MSWPSHMPHQKNPNSSSFFSIMVGLAHFESLNKPSSHYIDSLVVSRIESLGYLTTILPISLSHRFKTKKQIADYQVYTQTHNIYLFSLILYCILINNISWCFFNKRCSTLLLNQLPFVHLSPRAAAAVHIDVLWTFLLRRRKNHLANIKRWINNSSSSSNLV